MQNMNHGAGRVVSIVFAAGKGSRMTGYNGNKTLLPLIPGESLYSGNRPLLVQVLENLPNGPKGIVVHHFAAEVKAATASFDATYIFQPQTNGTGGALLAATSFLESVDETRVIVTMGDVPLIRAATYSLLIEQLRSHDLAVLAFEPQDRAQYGMLELDGPRVLRITEWKYWKDYTSERQQRLRYCNAGVYAARRPVLLEYMALLEQKPHHVQKQRGNKWVTIEEYFLTDLVELMSGKGLAVGMMTADEAEVNGVDTPEALQSVQQQYAKFA
jgi:bifunctional UDP-N-acetylglucosamine pyrophosphorylase / glucosamine-1-phosphate N-acetyltransferase